MSCHQLGDLGQQLGPELTGAGKHGVRYYLENVIDPDAVVDGELHPFKKHASAPSGVLTDRQRKSALFNGMRLGDRVRIKAQAGGDEEEHSVSVHGVKWLKAGSAFGRAPNQRPRR
jgi:hypothetical protein